MDVVTVLAAAVGVMGTKAIDESTKLAVAEVWSLLKSAIKKKRGADSPALDVIDDVERTRPEQSVSPVLAQRVNALALGSDSDIASLIQRLDQLMAERVPPTVMKQYNFHGGTFNNTTFN